MVIKYSSSEMEKKGCCEREGAWCSEEDEVLIKYVQVHGEGNWEHLSKTAGLKRCGESCKHRWLNYLKPYMNRSNFSLDEQELIIRLHKLLGNRWSLIAGRLPGHTENEIKHFWNTHLSKKEEEMQRKNKLPRTSTSIPHFQYLKCNKNSLHARETPHLVIKPKVVRLTKAVMQVHLQ